MASAEEMKAALERILALDPEKDSDEGFNEWGEADCFRQAQRVAADVLGVKVVE